MIILASIKYAWLVDFSVYGYLSQQVKKSIPYSDWAPCCFISLILIFSYSYLRSLFSLSLDLGENHFQGKYIFNLSHKSNQIPVSFCHLSYHSSFHRYLNWFRRNRITLVFFSALVPKNSFKNLFYQERKCASDSLKTHPIVSSPDNAARPASHVSWRTTGEPRWIIGPARRAKLEKPLSTSSFWEMTGRKGFCVKCY